MDLPQQPIEIERKKNFFSFLKIGLFEIGFVSIILALLFIILNYFQIIHLSQLFPFSPSLPSENTTQQSIGPADSKTFFEKSLSQLLLPAFLPSNGPQTSQGQISVTWSIRGTNFSAKALTQSGSLRNHFLLSIQPPNTIDVPLNDTSAAILAQQYLHKQSSTSYMCDETAARVFCQQTTKTVNEKISIGVRQNLSATASSKLVIFACAVPPINILFQSTDSCF